MNEHIIVARYRNEKGEMIVRSTYGPYPSKEAAEKANNEILDFPSPEYNLIVPMWRTEADEEERTEFFLRINQLANRVRLGMNCQVRIGQDEEVPDGYGRFFFQIRCYRRDVITGKMGFGYGGKAYLSPRMTDSELFQIIFGLYKGYWEHEARENFEIDGLRPFGPHISTEALLSVAKKVDVRSAKHVEDQLDADKVTEILDEAERIFIEEAVSSRHHMEDDLTNRIEHHRQNYPGTSLDI